MIPVLVPLPGNEEMAARLAHVLGGETGRLEVRHFPDGETYLRYAEPVEGRKLALVCTLDRPDTKILPVIFAAATARELGAASVGLVAPYLAYMRQDRRFKPGEAVTSAVFARMLAAELDWLVTVDPHLHRRQSLAEIYSIPTRVVHTAPLISAWIARVVERPLLVGPDSESGQWVVAVAEEAHAPHIVLEKARRGDRDVEVSVPEVARWRDHTPVLVDDIVSTGRTMIATVGHLTRAGMRAPICVGVHGIFAGDAYEALQKAGAGRIITTNAVTHPSNAIDLTGVLAEAVRALSP